MKKPTLGPSEACRKEESSSTIYGMTVRSISENIQKASEVTDAITVLGALAFLIAKVEGLVVSLWTMGQYTTLNAAIVSSPFFYIPVGAAALFSLTVKVIEIAASSLQRTQ